MKVVVISGHPDLKSSVANSVILDELQKQLPEVEVRKLDELHTHGQFDVEAEKAAILSADLIVWQFPIFWYSVPALLKKWLEDVFQYGFAYGSTAVLGGKKLLLSCTAGAPVEAYTGKEGLMAEFEQLTEMFKGVCRLCNLDYKGTEVLFGMSPMARQSEEGIAEQREQARAYASQLVAKINTL